MVSPLRGAWRLTLRSYCEIPDTVKLLGPPQQSWGVSHICLARALGADAFLMLTDVDAVWTGWGEPGARAIQRISPAMIRRYPFATGSMGPKIEAACAFVEQTGGIAGIGGLEDAQAILAGRAGTLVVPDAPAASWWD